MNIFKNKYPVIVGIFISIGLIILVVVVFTLGNQHSTFVKKFEVKALFEDIGGLKIGDNIWLSGVKIGIVKNIDFANDGAVIITMNIEKRVNELIHQNSKVRLSSDGLMGNRIVIIYGGTKDSPLVTETDHLTTEKSTDTKDMLATLDATNKNLLVITNNLKEVSNKILTGKGTIANLLNDSLLPENLKLTARDLKYAVADFKKVSGKTENVMDNIDDFTNQLNKQGTLMHDLVTDTIVFNNLRGSIGQLKVTMNSIASFSDNIKNASDALNDKNKITGVFLHDEQKALQLKSMIKNLDSASHKLDEDLEAVRHNFLLKGYFKKKERNEK